MVYLDDIIIYSNTKEKYKLYIRKIFQKLVSAGLQIDIRKYKFKIQRTKFLGYIIGIDNIKVDLDKIIIIKT
jgi:hypothetical protein